jgi:hypothetical protein
VLAAARQQLCQRQHMLHTTGVWGRLRVMRQH